MEEFKNMNMAGLNGNGEAKCPFLEGAVKQSAGGGTSNRDWWPNQLNVDMLHEHSERSSPMGESFNYAEAFKTLDLKAVVKDLHALMTDSQDWWPADYGHYGPFFVRMACTAPAPTASEMVVAVQALAHNDLPLSTAGLTTLALTRRAACSGPSSRNTVAKSHGPT